MASAQTVYRTPCATMEESGLKCSKYDSNMSVHCQFAGDGVTYDFAAGVTSRV